MSNLKEKVEAVKGWFIEKESVVVAFSGGVDSSLLAYLAYQSLGIQKMLAVFSYSSSVKQREAEEVRALARCYGFPLRIVQTKEINDPRYYKNPIDRCFVCKSYLYERLEVIRKELGFSCIVNGQNRDDLGDYRPGIKAAQHFRVFSPFIELGIGKLQIREMARFLGLWVWKKPSSPCLSSRFPYGYEITEEKLRQVEKAEDFIQSLGVLSCRVRHWGDKAVVEVPVAYHKLILRNRAKIQEKFLEIGFQRWELDPEGLVSGKLNRYIREGGRRG